MWLQGWGAFTQVAIQRGQFVAQYAGELITSQEAARRLAAIDAAPGPTCHALLVVFPSSHKHHEAVWCMIAICPVQHKVIQRSSCMSAARL